MTVLQQLGCCVMVVGCGRIGFDPTSGPAGLPAPINELDTPKDERDPTLTADMLEIFFMVTSAAANDADIWHATRASIADPFGAPALVPELYTTAFEDTPEISPDGLTILFARGGSNARIYVATRPTRADAWSTPVLAPELGASEVRPGSLLFNGLKLYVNQGVAGLTDILVATRASVTDPWNTPVLVSELYSPESDADPAVDPTDFVIYFSRPGTDQLLDIVRAVRPDTGAPFSSPQPLDEVNSAADDSDPWISPQRDVLVFSSGRDGTRRLYIATVESP